MLLTSYDRVFDYISTEDSTLDKTQINSRTIINWIAAVSARIEKYLNRELEIKSRTKYFDVTHRRVQFFPEAIPMVSITSVKSDSTGRFDGGETTLSSDNEYYIGADSDTLVLRRPRNWETLRGLQMTYTGGMAVSAVQSIFTLSSVSGTWAASTATADKYMYSINDAFGKVTAVSGNQITVDNLYGLFDVNDTVYNVDNDASIDETNDAYGTISTIDQQSLAESNPDIVAAAEMEVRYMWKHKHDFEVTEVIPEGGSTRRGGRAFYDLQPETKAMLEKHVRWIV